MNEDKCDTCKIKEQCDNLEKGLRMAIRFIINMKELMEKSVGGNEQD